MIRSSVLLISALLGTGCMPVTQITPGGPVSAERIEYPELGANVTAGLGERLVAKGTRMTHRAGLGSQTAENLTVTVDRTPVIRAMRDVGFLSVRSVKDHPVTSLISHNIDGLDRPPISTAKLKTSEDDSVANSGC